jgi:hypothetical protein
MPRPVAIRSDYRNDAGYLLRLESAIVKDTRQTEEWRNETAQMLRQLSMRLLEADAQKNMGGKDASEPMIPRSKIRGSKTLGSKVHEEASVSSGSIGRKIIPPLKAAAR